LTRSKSDIAEFVANFRRYKEPWQRRKGYRLFYNENLLLPDEYFAELVKRAEIEPSDIRNYNDPYNLSVRMMISEFYKVPVENIFFGAGVDRIISMLVDLAKVLGKKIAVVEPTYEIYSERSLSRGIEPKKILLRNDFSLNVEKILAEVDKDYILFICSPNNPTGNQFSREKVLTVVENTDALVVLDETYADYGEYTLIDSAMSIENFVVLRSFSKSWGLAGLRAGFAVASEKVVSALEKLDEPYSVSSVVKKIVTGALSLYEKYVLKSIEETKRIRDWLYKKLQETSLTPYPSQANFILFRSQRKDQLLVRLAEKGFLLKDTSSLPLLQNTLRVTVPPPDTAEEFVQALRELLDL